MKLLLTTAAAALLLASAAFAAPGAGMGGPPKADANGDGKITLAEFKAARLNMMMRADANRDGKLSEAEMQAARAQRASMRGGQGGLDGAPKGDGSRMFTMMDANHDGFLDKGEIGRMLERRFQRLDVDGDGVLSASEQAAGRQQRGMGGQGGAL